MEKVDRILKLYAQAKGRRELWNQLINLACRYALPRHEEDASTTEGQPSRDPDVVYSGAMQAVKRRRSKLHSLLFPVNQKWMEFELLHKKINPEDKKIKDYLRMVNDKFHQVIEHSNFHMEIDSALGDCLISTGALGVVATENPEVPVNFEAISINSIIPVQGHSQLIDGVFRKWELSWQEAVDIWGDKLIKPSEVSEDNEGKTEDSYNKKEKIVFIEALLFESGIRLWNYDVISGEQILFTNAFKTPPIILFRLDKIPGETMGRGPVLEALPTIQSANMVLLLMLRHAGYAIEGVWKIDSVSGADATAIADLRPGTLLPYKAGTRGLEKVEPPGNLFIGETLLTKLDTHINEIINGQDEPPENIRKTAYEVSAWQAQQQAQELPASLRLIQELVLPLAQRIIHILRSPQTKASPFHIEDYEGMQDDVILRAVSPIMKLQNAVEAKTFYDATIAVLQMNPQLAQGVIDLPEFMKEFLTLIGFPVKLLQDATSRAKYEAMVRHEQARLEAQERAEAAEKAKKEQEERGQPTNSPGAAGGNNILDMMNQGAGAGAGAGAGEGLGEEEGLPPEAV